MAEIINAIRTVLDDSEFHYNYDEDYNCFSFGLNVDNGTVQVRLIAREKDDYFMCIAIWEGRLPVRSLPLVLPLINEINNNTKFTTVSIDPKDGELSCHVGFNTDDADISPKQVWISMQVAVKTLDENIEQIMRAAWNAPSNADGKFN